MPSIPPPFFGFGAEITFDGSILQFNSVSFGPSFGNPLDKAETLIFTRFLPEKLATLIGAHLSEAKHLPLQPESFTFATLKFTGNHAGVSQLSIIGGGVDSIGNQDAAIGIPASTSVQPTDSGRVVPEPTTILLLATGLLLMYRWRKHEPFTH